MNKLEEKYCEESETKKIKVDKTKPKVKSKRGSKK